MADTDRINLGHVKIIAEKIKDWFEKYYPITYDGTFKWYPTKDKTNVAIEFAEDVTNISPVDFNATTDDGYMALKNYQYVLAPDKTGARSLYASNGSAMSITAPEGAYIGINSMTDSNEDIWGMTLTQEDGVLVQAPANVNLTANDEKVKLSLKDGDLVLKDDYNSTPHCRLIMGDQADSLAVLRPYGLYYHGHTVQTGHTVSFATGDHTKVLAKNSSTWQDCGGTLGLGEGVWAISYCIWHKDGDLVDGQRLAGRVTLNGSNISGSRRIITTGSAGNACINGTCIAYCPNATNQIQLQGYQTAIAASKTVHYDMTAIKLS